MKYLSVALCLSLFALAVVADTGYYVPKAFYTIDSNGQRSPLYFINPAEASHGRVRRSPQFSGSGSTASSTSTGSGGPIYFGPPQGFYPNFGFPGVGVFPGGSGSSTFSGVSTSTSTGGGGGLHSRFGEDEPGQTTGTTHTISGHNGQFTSTSSHLGTDGKVHYSVQTGKF